MNKLSFIYSREDGVLFMGGNILLNQVYIRQFSIGTVMPEPNHNSNFIQQLCFRHKNQLIITLKQYKPGLCVKYFLLLEFESILFCVKNV